MKTPAAKTYKFLERGSPLIVVQTITTQMKRFKLMNKDRLPADIPVNSYARVHSQAGADIIVWVLDERRFDTLILSVPTDLMGQFFKQHAHGLFPHFS